MVRNLLDSKKRRVPMTPPTDWPLLSPTTIIHALLISPARPGNVPPHTGMQANTQQPIRVLLVDDHAVVRTGIRQFWKRQPTSTSSLKPKTDAVHRCCSSNISPISPYLDLQLPDMSGVELARWLRNHYPAIGILVVTAYDEDPYVTAALNAGADGYMLKTASPAELIDAVRAVHTGRAALDLSIARKVMRLSGATSAEGPG